MTVMKFARTSLALVCASSAVAACQTMPPVEQTAATDQTYIARGNEPGWILKMDGKTVDYLGDYGETKIKIPAPEARPSFNGTRHVADRLTVDITFAACIDDMSGKRFTDTVTVMAEGKQVRGCGGRALPPESLNDTSWKIIMFDEVPVLEGAKTEVRFADGRVTGTAGCNRLNGSYSAGSNRITFRGVAATKMMCPEKQMMQEAKALALLAGTVTTRYSFQGDLILADDKGNRMTLRQVP